MPVPSTDGSPNRYQPNPADDRAIREATKDGPESIAYFGVASALDALEDSFERETFSKLNPNTRRALRSAENALRRAGFGLVVYAQNRS